MPAADAFGTIRDHVFDREDFSRNLRAARMKKTYHEYTREVLVQTALALAISVLVVIVFHLFPSGSRFSSHSPSLCRMPLSSWSRRP